MLLTLLGLCFGLALLIWSADRFVSGAVGVSQHFGIPAIVIGIVVIGFGTSAPELLISSISAWQGNGGLAIGNAIGSNIANIALILGTTAILTPIVVSSGTTLREFPVLLGATGLVWILFRDSELSLIDGIILIGTLVVALVYLTLSALRSEQSEFNQDTGDNSDNSVLQAVTWTIIGLLLLLVSSRILVTNSIELALFFGVSDVVIGLTIVAIGTSLPELAASITGALKHHSDLAVGNVIGSNIFNTLGVIGIPGLILSYDIPREVLVRDYPIMLALTLLFIVMALITRRSKGMHRGCGALLLICFIAFQITLYVQSINT